MSNETIYNTNNQSTSEKRNDWFEALLNNINSDRQFLDLGIAPKETEEFYQKLIFGKQTEIVSELREKSTQFFIEKLILDYVDELKKLEVKPLSLYLDFDDSQLLVWAEIKEDDDATEMGLYRAEAKANAKNYQHGVHISSTILEDIDNLKAPSHYQIIFNHKQ